jgi:hypothetical protein
MISHICDPNPTDTIQVKQGDSLTVIQPTNFHFSVTTSCNVISGKEEDPTDDIPFIKLT